MSQSLSLAALCLGSVLRCGQSLTLKTRAPDAVFALHYGSCSCDLRSLECLPSPKCLESVRGNASESIDLGRRTRVALRSSIRTDRSLFLPISSNFPLGKVITYGAIDSWERWIEGDGLPAGWSPSTYRAFVDTGRFAECRREGRSAEGAGCFWKPFDAAEAVGEVERGAGALAGSSSTRAVETIREDLETFRERVLASPGAKVAANAHVMSMAHIAYIQFNIRSSLESSYVRHLVTKAPRRAAPGLGCLRVGLHVRRADSCSELNSNGYQQEASDITTHAQMTNVRLCYGIKVYVDALKRIYDVYKLPLAVYVSSDDAGSILREAEEHDSDFFHAHTWRYLDWPRGGFQYSGTVEIQNASEAGFLGETAAVEAWHLSHSEVFVDHLGSRYGKGAYLLASARHNVPAPYVSVDGHNYCCQNDEQCSKATAALTGIIDCLTFAPEITYTNVNQKGTYWDDGVTVRFDRSPSERNIFLFPNGHNNDEHPHDD